MSPVVQGLVRFRKHQLGRQASFGTKVAAKRAYPWRGVPSVELNWTDPDVDAGSIYPVAPPDRTGDDLTFDPTDAGLAYNNIPVLMGAFFGGQETPTGAGTAKTWTHDADPTTPVQPDPFTYEWGDDVTDDWYQFGDSVLESVEITGPEGLGALSVAMNWRMGSMSSTGSTDHPVSGTVPTPGLSVDTEPVKVFLKDGSLFISDTLAGLDASQISDALHTFVLRISGDLDLKRWANGDQSFDVDALARASGSIELECTFSKTDDTVGVGSESDKWMSDNAVTRYARLFFESREDAEYDTPYSWQLTFPMRYYTRTEGESGGNSVIVLTGHAFFEPVDFDGVFQSVAVTTLAAASL